MKKTDLIKDTANFVRWHLGANRNPRTSSVFAPHTGQDWPAWCAFVHLMRCWTHGGAGDALNAMHSTLLCAQSTEAVLRTFVQVIPAVGDWSHVAQIWPVIASGIVIRGTDRSARELCAVERNCDYDDKDRPIPGTDRCQLHGWRPTRNLELVK